jgi:hypothetical protein
MTGSSASTPAAPAGAVPTDPKAAVSLPPDSPAAKMPTTSAATALANAVPALPTGEWNVKTVLIFAFAILWFTFGLVGFILSLICFGYSGSTGEKIMGLVIALALGPWFFLYYFSSGSYCKRMPPTLF